MSILKAPKRETIDDLLKVEGKAELINGRIIRFKPYGMLPGIVCGRIFLPMDAFVEHPLAGSVYGATIGFAIHALPSGRESFSPDVSYYDGPLPKNLMRFIEGPSTFAVEVQSKETNSTEDERMRTAKRVDYFAAGTKAVWDVDPIQQVIRLYVDDAEVPVATFRTGDQAHAEPGVAGWKLEVGELFR